MRVESAPGKGSRITLISPPLKDAARPDGSETPGPSATATRAVAFEASYGIHKKIRLLLVDDHAIMRQGLTKLLGDEADMEIAGEASDGETAIEMVRDLAPDVVLMDISMPGMGGVAATRAIHSSHPEAIVIGLSMFEEPERAAEMRKAGASDYVTKSDASEKLVEAIRACWNKQCA
jgi:CheY-like chemotaxis protein